MSKFQFKGDWEFQLQLPAFKKYTYAFKRYSDNTMYDALMHSVDIAIEDHEEENPDPYPEQIAAIEYLIEHQNDIVRSIDKGLFEIYPKFRREAYYEEYDLDEINYTDTLEPADASSYLKESFPAIFDSSEMHKVSCISRITILTEQKSGVAYMEFDANCNWDEDHGHEFILHKDRIVEMSGYPGSADVYLLPKDMELDIEEYKIEWNKKNDARNEKFNIPKFYFPHPKYCKLRAWEQDANDRYWWVFIRSKGEQAFIDWYLSESPAFEQQYKPLPTLVFNRACNLNYNEIINSFLENYLDQINLNEGLVNCLKALNKNNAMKLLERGAEFETNTRNRPFMILFQIFGRTYPEPNSPFYTKFYETTEWLYSLGLRPSKLNPVNDFGELDCYEAKKKTILDYVKTLDEKYD